MILVLKSKGNRSREKDIVDEWSHSITTIKTCSRTAAVLEEKLLANFKQTMRLCMSSKINVASDNKSNLGKKTE
ncbi:hypothetical protein K7432_010916 [Basidiobolus ranarum]|uniref:Uncharacterized protein n=1 Tax=Basidiobolus ranarum TaxID=34480 RepID=A0ABR2VV84_9FUNG